MVTIPEGIFWSPYLLQILVAKSAEFQAQVGAADWNEALPFTYYPEVYPSNPNPGDPDAVNNNNGWPPRAIITDDAEIAPYQRTQVALGSWRGEQQLLLSIELVVPEAEHALGNQNAAYWVMKHTGRILKDMELLAGQDEAYPGAGVTNFNMQSYGRLEGPFELDTAELGLPPLADGKTPQHVWVTIFQVEVH